MTALSDLPEQIDPKFRDPVDLHIGRRIRELRRERGLTQAEFGRRIERSYQQIQKFEAAENRVTVGQLWQIAGALGVGLNEIFPTTEYPVTHDPTAEALQRLPEKMRSLIVQLADMIADEHPAE